MSDYRQIQLIRITLPLLLITLYMSPLLLQSGKYLHLPRDNLYSPPRLHSHFPVSTANSNSRMEAHSWIFIFNTSHFQLTTA